MASMTGRQVEGEGGSNLCDRFLALVAESPSAEMFQFADAQGRIASILTRGELHRQAQAIAGLLQRHGIAPGERVLLAYTFSIDVVPALVGCLLAGVVPAPISPPNPARLRADLPRFEQIARDSGCCAVLTNAAYYRYRRVGNIRSPLLTRGTLWRDLPWRRTDVEASTTPTETEPVRYPARPDDVAFLQYTSGSTSEPKGVMVSHSNLAAQIDAIQSRIRVGRSSRLLAWIPYYHDHCLVGGIFNVLLSGGRFCLMSPLTFLRNPGAWFDALTSIRATGTAAPAFAFHYALNKTTPEQRKRWDLSSLDVFQSGGEPILPALVDPFLDAFAETGLRREAFSPGYGMAEHVLGIAIDGHNRVSLDRGQYASSGCIVASAAPDAVKLIGNGTPLDQVRIEIVDEVSRRPLGPDQVGEIWVSSPSVAMGYWGKPELTAEVFDVKLADDPDGAGFLRTGDLGFLHGGELYVSGRIKDTIIVRGRNIYPQDVELLVSHAHPSIRRGRATAFALTGEDGREALAVVAETRSRTLSGQLGQAVADAVRERVTSALNVACRTVVLVRPDTIFKTTSGKQQRSRTRASYLDGSMAASVVWRDALPPDSDSNTGPREIAGASAPTPLTQAAVEAWLTGRVAGIEGLSGENIDVTAPLGRFALDSLALMGLGAELAAWSGRDLSHDVILGADSLRALAVAVLSSDSNSGVPVRVPRLTDDTLMPLNPSQGWLFEPEGPDPHGWSIGMLLKSPARLDTAVMQQALARVVAHHDALRLRLVETESGWKQRVLGEDAPQVEVIDLSSTVRAGLDDAIGRQVVERQHALHFSNGPIVRLVVFRLGVDREDRVLLLVHHAAVDAYSFELVLGDLMRTYDRLMAGEAAALLPPSAGYGEWMAALQRMAASQEVLCAADYWRRFPRLPPLPVDRATGSNTNLYFTSLGRWISLEASQELLRTAPEKSGVPTWALVLTALVQTLHEYTGEVEHIVEFPHHGRTRAVPGLDLSRSVGWISNNYPVHLRLPLDMVALGQAKSLREQAAIARDGLDYGLLRYMHPDPAVRQSMRQAPQPQVKLLWYGQTHSLVQPLLERYPIASETVEMSFEPDQSMLYQFSFYGWVVAGRIRLEVGCSADRYSDETREQLLATWLRATERFA